MPDVRIAAITYADPVEKFTAVLQGIGGKVIDVTSWEEIGATIKKNAQGSENVISTIPQLPVTGAAYSFSARPHLMENVELAVLQGQFGVAENGAIWVTDANMGDRALPFICHHLALVIHRADIVQTLHDAYERIGASPHEFGAFIAGPSKTADIEQSLVLGAHGPKSLVVFIMNKPYLASHATSIS